MRQSTAIAALIALATMSCTKREEDRPVAPRVEIPTPTAGGEGGDATGVTARYNAAKAKRLSDMKKNGKELTPDEQQFLEDHPLPDEGKEGKAKDRKGKKDDSS